MPSKFRPSMSMPLKSQYRKTFSRQSRGYVASIFSYSTSICSSSLCGKSTFEAFGRIGGIFHRRVERGCVAISGERPIWFALELVGQGAAHVGAQALGIDFQRCIVVVDRAVTICGIAQMRAAPDTCRG